MGLWWCTISCFTDNCATKGSKKKKKSSQESLTNHPFVCPKTWVPSSQCWALLCLCSCCFSARRQKPSALEHGLLWKYLSSYVCSKTVSATMTLKVFHLKKKKKVFWKKILCSALGMMLCCGWGDWIPLFAPSLFGLCGSWPPVCSSSFCPSPFTDEVGVRLALLEKPLCCKRTWPWRLPLPHALWKGQRGN